MKYWLCKNAQHSQKKEKPGMKECARVIEVGESLGHTISLVQPWVPVTKPVSKSKMERDLGRHVLSLAFICTNLHRKTFLSYSSAFLLISVEHQ